MRDTAVRNFLDSDVSEACRRLVGDRDLFSVSELYHENSKIVASAAHFGTSTGAMSVASHGFKRFQHMDLESLPSPRPLDASLSVAITMRRSCRSFDGRPLALADIADLTFLALGSQGPGRRCLPSAGGLYPLELYVAASRVEGLSPGVLHYDARAHALARLSFADPVAAVRPAIFIPEALEGAAAVILLTAMFGRSKIKYGERAYRFALLEAGHAMQSLLLVATALQLGACPVGGFIDDQLHDLLDVDGVEESVLYAAILGHPT
jgi:SagB-type dehydrogenase family enzyme